ncbi:PEP-CTERM sorting domain-containing protein [Ferribacterium limneticum]|uniref:PEP-CTERM sorting domain-containing protein n=1 Tax=Ferribacterium limneticum TaxID=76259 RepID=UPI001CFA2B57|nr:PEP-CTERM sorting domain-containing protein [Ferribacterium limneticum]UCV18456.1 PEP-CTERM sorting domain-containing protein [Ferribacterium limneticum]
MFNQLKPLAALIATALISTSALAATQTLDAGNYTISYDDSFLGLFGTPTLTASGISFATGGVPGFTAVNSVLEATVSLTITADAGYKLTSFNLGEKGSYFKVDNSSSVFVGGNLTVQDLVNTSSSVIKDIVTVPLTDTTTFNSQFHVSTWNASTSAHLETAKAAVSIFDVLGAIPANGGYASIGKTNVILDVGVAAVPEPQSFAMLLAGLGIIGAVARRRRIGA